MPIEGLAWFQHKKSHHKISRVIRDSGILFGHTLLKGRSHKIQKIPGRWHCNDTQILSVASIKLDSWRDRVLKCGEVMCVGNFAKRGSIRNENEGRDILFGRENHTPTGYPIGVWGGIFCNNPLDFFIYLNFEAFWGGIFCKGLLDPFNRHLSR